eukprot:TRINITY_DN4142_c0_g1_i1.p1 TRINITY_DN4142_c0_g1~~TRINITY_DN4142_c0_g1_i1.p1  ORF type:complete len:413 (-),score=208.68 TRINITY_DN4142_c0_g1_i1:16-1254(-)
MELKSVFVLAPDGEILIVKHYRAKSARSVAELFWSHVIKAAPSPPPPVIDAGRHMLISIERDGVWFLGVVTAETAPLLVIDFLQRIHSTFTGYLGSVSAQTLKAHFTTVYQLLDEMMDYGVPFTTEDNALRDIVSAPGGIAGLASSMLAKSLVADALPSAHAGDVDWRRRGVKHRTNEMFVDLIESISCIVDTSGALVASSLSAAFLCDSRLSAAPDLVMRLSGASSMEDVAFHRCVRHKQWSKSKVISFVPPDGKFKLATFRAHGALRLPLRVEPKIRMNTGGGNVCIRVTPLDLSSKPLTDVRLVLRCSKLVASAALSADAGRVVFDDTLKTCTWSIGTMKPSVTVELSGTLVLPAGVQVEQPTLAVEFSQQGWTPSGIKITELAISKVDYAPFKGVRYIVKSGTVEIRT